MPHVACRWLWNAYGHHQPRRPGEQEREIERSKTGHRRRNRGGSPPRRSPRASGVATKRREQDGRETVSSPRPRRHSPETAVVVLFEREEAARTRPPRTRPSSGTRRGTPVRRVPNATRWPKRRCSATVMATHSAVDATAVTASVPSGPGEIRVARYRQDPRARRILDDAIDVGQRTGPDARGARAPGKIADPRRLAPCLYANSWSADPAASSARVAPIIGQGNERRTLIGDTARGSSATTSPARTAPRVEIPRMRRVQSRPRSARAWTPTDLEPGGVPERGHGNRPHGVGAAHADRPRGSGSLPPGCVVTTSPGRTTRARWRSARSGPERVSTTWTAAGTTTNRS